MEKQSCKNCRFWIDDCDERHPEMENYHDCRRHAPQLIMIQVPDMLKSQTSIRIEGGYGDCVLEDYEGNMRTRVWPLTESFDWCGEWQPVSNEPENS